MDGPNDNPKRLARLLDEVAVHEGAHPTWIEGVQVVRRSQPMPRTPMVYAPNIVVVGLDSRLLGRQTIREILYRVLRSEHGGPWRAGTNTSAESRGS